MQDFTAEEAREIYEVRELLESFALERVEQSNSGILVDPGLNGRLYSCKLPPIGMGLHPCRTSPSRDLLSTIVLRSLQRVQMIEVLSKGSSQHKDCRPECELREKTCAMA